MKILTKRMMNNRDEKQGLDKDPALIQSMFGKISKRYDVANSILSFNLHALWNKRLAKLLCHQAPGTLLDLCAGTGEIAYRYLDMQTTPQNVILIDFCAEMLQGAHKKSAPYLARGHALNFIQADAMAIPLPPTCVDAVSIAYGVRNIHTPQTCFKEVHRILNSDGKLAILELTEPKNALLRSLHTVYLNHILPTIGGFLTQERKAYAYLAKSVQTFAKPEEVKSQLKEVGFQKITIEPLTFGIATLIQAWK